MTTSRLSYASSPESDLELSPGPSASLSLGNLPQLVKSCSDPSIATNQDNLDRDRELNIGDGMPPPYTVSYKIYHLSFIIFFYFLYIFFCFFLVLYFIIIFNL